MPRSATTSVENNFSRGLITEATAMNYPENSVVEADNCIFAKNGQVIRRYGIDYETDYVVTDFSALNIYSTAPTPSVYYGDMVVKEFEWASVDNNGSISFTCVQLGNKIVFFKTSASNTISSQLKTYDINLKTYQVPTYSSDYGQYVGSIPVSFASGFGYMFICHPLCNPLYVSYDPDTDAITVTAITITIRDFARLDDTYAVDFRPSSLTDLHKYNLYNQGWHITAKNAAGTTINVVTYWDNTSTDWPSNADIWYVYKNTSNVIDSTLFSTKAMGNTPAPNGHYTYDAFDVDRDATLGTTGLPAESSGDYRPSVNAFFSGRVWYAGVNVQGYSTKVYFSKIIEGVNDFGKCFQQADPTSEEFSDLLPTDGGVISIPDMDSVLKMVPVGASLLIFATNGIWKISGPNDNFTANDYFVAKISSASVTAPNSIVIAEGTPFWWDRAGIYSIQFDASTGRETVVNISESTIQSVINEISEDNLHYVKGAYNNINKTIHWLYRSTEATTVRENYEYDKLLVLSLVGQSFSPSTISDGTPKVAGVLFTTNAHFDPLVTEPGASLTKFITIGDIGTAGVKGITVSQFNDDSYMDWFTFDTEGVDFSSFFITGYRVRGELLRKFQSNYIVVVMRQEPNASCYMQGVWDYSNDTDNGRYTSSQQVFNEDETFDYSRAKRKIRGSGYSCQFKFFSETGKPFTLVGWSVSETGNNVP